jgi:hypothetical protein
MPRLISTLRAAGAGLLVATGALAAAPETPPMDAKTINGAVLQGLDKTTARITKFTAVLGQLVKFGTLEIRVKDCRQNPPEEDPESAAFLDIDEMRPGQAVAEHVFTGWMFASSPALSPLEHPVYDVWVLDCSMSNGSASKRG